MNKIFIAMFFLAATTTSYAQVVCFQDASGLTSDANKWMEDYQQQVKKWGVQLTFKAIDDDSKLSEDFRTGFCDMAIIRSSMSSFNRFVRTFDAVGALSNDNVANVLVTKIIPNQQLAQKMIEGKFEVAGLLPSFPSYIFVKNRQISTVDLLKGKKIALIVGDLNTKTAINRITLDFHPVSSFINNMGAQPVQTGVESPYLVENLIKNKSDAVVLYSDVYKKMKLADFLGQNGGIISMPFSYSSSKILIHTAAFPNGFGQQSRIYIAAQSETQFALINKVKSDIPSKYWIELGDIEKSKFQEIFYKARTDLLRTGFYDSVFFKLTHSITCKMEPMNYECKLINK